MRGNITRRGKRSWRLKFDAGRDQDGKRLIHYRTVQGTKKGAEQELAKRLNELADGRYIAPTADTVETYARHWLENIAPARRSAVTVERYRTLIETHLIPNIGSVTLQKLDGVAIDKLYAHLRTKGRWFGGGLSPMTLHHVHSALSQILASAVRTKKLARSPIGDVETKPKPSQKKVEILDEAELVRLLDHLKGHHTLYMPTLLAAHTGLRRGEVLGLRWREIDFAKGTLNVSQSVAVVGGKIIVKAPKNERSRRTIKLPAALLPELTCHRKEQSAQRLRLGLGKDEADLVFTSPLGGMLDPQYFTEAFVREAGIAGKKVTFHALRHTHITHLLRAGVPVHVVAARAGHAKPSVTLDVYSHLLGGDDDRAAEEADKMLTRVLK